MTRPAARWWSWAVVLVLGGCSALPGLAPEGERAQAFTLKVETPEAAVRETLVRHLALQRFADQPGLQPRELARLLEATPQDARQLLATLGYFAPTLVLQRDAASTASPPVITLEVVPGPLTPIAAVQVAVTGALAQSRAVPDLRLQAALQEAGAQYVGQPFSQSGWDQLKAEGLHRLQLERYPAARISQSHADIDLERQRAELTVTYDSGPAYRFGPLQVLGGQRYDSDAARHIARLPTGTDYRQTELLDAQQRLAGSGYYDAVFLTLDTDAADPQAAPVRAQVREALLQKWVFGLGLSTDSGTRLGIDHTHNLLPGLGWRAVSKLAWDDKAKLLGSEWTATPDKSGWRWFASAQGQRQTTGSYEVNSLQLRGGQNQLSDHIDRSAYLQYDDSRPQGGNAPDASAAVSVHYSWTGRYFDSRTQPGAGYGMAWTLGLGSTLRGQRDPFVRATVRWLGLWPLAAEGQAEQRRAGRLALRAEGGAVWARDGAAIPTTQLFLTGGDTTVRGYGYRTIGARSAPHQPLFAGRHLAVTSLEWQRPIWGQNSQPSEWESTLFMDVGAVGDSGAALAPRVGVGTGVRWRSPVGPVQADLAYGVQAKALRLHLRLGFEF